MMFPPTSVNRLRSPFAYSWILSVFLFVLSFLATSSPHSSVTSLFLSCHAQLTFSSLDSPTASYASHPMDSTHHLSEDDHSSVTVTSSSSPSPIESASENVTVTFSSTVFPESPFHHVSLGLLYAITIHGTGKQRAAGALMAIRAINNHTGRGGISYRGAPYSKDLVRHIIPATQELMDSGVRIKYILNDTQIYQDVALAATLQQVQEKKVQALVGDDLSTVCVPIQQVARIYGVPQISYSCTATLFSNKDDYPTFMRTVPSDDNQGNILANLVVTYGWKSVAVMHTTDIYALGIRSAFAHACAINNIDIIQSISFSQYGAPEEILEALLTVKRAEARIILFFGCCSDVTNIMSLAARNASMFTDEYVWILSDAGVQPQLLNLPGVGRTGKAVGVLGTEPYDGSNTPSYQAFIQQWNASKAADFPEIWSLKDSDFVGVPNSKVPHSYDAILTLAYAAKRVTDKGLNISANTLMKELRDPAFSFQGITGQIKFDSFGNRISTYSIKNMGPDGTLRTLAIVDTNFTEESKQTLRRYVTFHSGSNMIPSDRPPVVYDQIDPSLIIILYSIAALEMVGLLILMFFSHKYRALPLMRASSPAILQWILLGCLAMLTNVYFLAQHGDAWCRIYGVSLGVPFLWVFGLIFAKAYRIWYIFSSDIYAVPLSDKTLLKRLLFLITFEFFFHVMWQLVDTDAEKLNGKSTIQSTCGASSHYFIWISASYGYKAIFFLYGLYLAFKTRKVAPTFSESKSILYVILNTALFCCVVLPLFYSNTSMTTRYLLQAVLIILGIAVVGGGLFVPKLLMIFSLADQGAASVIQMTQLTLNKSVHSPTKQNNANPQPSPTFGRKRPNAGNVVEELNTIANGGTAMKYDEAQLQVYLASPAVASQSYMYEHHHHHHQQQQQQPYPRPSPAGSLTPVAPPVVAGTVAAPLLKTQEQQQQQKAMPVTAATIVTLHQDPQAMMKAQEKENPVGTKESLSPSLSPSPPVPSPASAHPHLYEDVSQLTPSSSQAVSGNGSHLSATHESPVVAQSSLGAHATMTLPVDEAMYNRVLTLCPLAAPMMLLDRQEKPHIKAVLETLINHMDDENFTIISLQRAIYSILIHHDFVQSRRRNHHSSQNSTAPNPFLHPISRHVKPTPKVAAPQQQHTNGHGAPTQTNASIPPTSTNTPLSNMMYSVNTSSLMIDEHKNNSVVTQTQVCSVSSTLRDVVLYPSLPDPFSLENHRISVSHGTHLPLSEQRGIYEDKDKDNEDENENENENGSENEEDIHVVRYHLADEEVDEKKIIVQETPSVGGTTSSVTTDQPSNQLQRVQSHPQPRSLQEIMNQLKQNKETH